MTPEQVGIVVMAMSCIIVLISDIRIFRLLNRSMCQTDKALNLIADMQEKIDRLEKEK